MRDRSRRMTPVFSSAAAALFVFAARSAPACSVCFGEPDSDMVQGAQAGVLFMVFVIYGLLLVVAGVFVWWAVRAHRMRLAGEIEVPTADRPSA